MSSQKSTHGSTITLADLAMVVKIIDICTERGAFKGEEIMAVGEIREKFSIFVEENTPTLDTETDVPEDNGESKD